MHGMGRAAGSWRVSSGPMSEPSRTPAVGLIRADLRLNQLFGFYLMALFMLLAFVVGSVYAALFIIVCSELLLTWRPTPALGPESFVGPTPAGWQNPIKVMRWFVLVRDYWHMVTGAVIFTVFMGFFLVVARPSQLGPGNYEVGAVVAAWLLTRPLWYPVLRKLIGRSLKGVKQDLSRSAAAVVVGADGIDVVQPVHVIGTADPARQGPWVFHITFAEIDELRMLSPMEAQTYWQTMAGYDPTLDVRAAYEMYRYLKGELPRPTIYQYMAAGAHLLIRSPSVLYLLAYADETGPAAIAAWQAWRAAHASPAMPAAPPA